MKINCKHCGKSFSVPDRWKGQVVECPQCGRTMRVEEPAKSGGKQVERPLPEPELEKKSRPSGMPGGPVASGAAPRAARRSTDDDELTLLPEEDTPRRHRVSLQDYLTDEQPSARPSTGELRRTARVDASGNTDRSSKAPTSSSRLKSDDAADCPNCGAMLPPDGIYCIECGYHLSLKRVLHGDLSDLDLDLSTGYVRWFRSQLQEGESGTSILWLTHVLVFIVLSIVGAIGHPHLWIPVIMAFLGYIGFWLWILKMGGVHFLGRIFWNWRLWCLRRFVWNRLPTWQYVQRSDRSFDDEQLAQLGSVDHIRVLDLEGTSISDRALVTFQHCERLQAAVVRRTRMTKNGVLRLQIMKPQISIWHDDYS